MRLLHTSDWHLGRSLETVPLVEHQRAFLDWLVALVEERGIDAVLVCGDVYDRSVPSVEAVGLLDHALASLIPHCPVVIIPGNHDSAERLGYGGDVFAVAGVHLRSHVEDIAHPVELQDADGSSVLVYGIPYLQPDVVRSALGTERSHAAVLTAAMDQVRADLAERSAEASTPPRSVVMAHAFVTGGQASDSERDVSVGGVADAPASVFAGVDYVALGHLHGPQPVGGTEAAVVRYSGTPLAYSFSEQAHVKSVTIVDLAADGSVSVEQVPAPVPRRLRKLTGELAELLSDATLEQHADDWVWADLTDTRRPEEAMEQVRTRFPHAIKLTWEPRVDGAPIGTIDRLVDPTAVSPTEVVLSFVEHVTSTPPSEDERTLVQASVERVTDAESGEDPT